MKGFATNWIVICVLCGVFVQLSFATIAENHNGQGERFESPYVSREDDLQMKDSRTNYYQNQKDNEANTLGNLCSLSASEIQITDNERLLPSESGPVVPTDSPTDSELDFLFFGANNDLSTEKGTCETRTISGNRKLTCTINKVDSALIYKYDDTYAKAEGWNKNNVNARSSLPNNRPDLLTESPAENEVDSVFADDLDDFYKDTYKINDIEKISVIFDSPQSFSTESPTDNEVDSVFSDTFDALKKGKTENVNINKRIASSASGNGEGNSPNINDQNSIPEKDENIKKEENTQKTKTGHQDKESPKKKEKDDSFVIYVVVVIIFLILTRG